MNDELERIWKEAVMALSRHSPGIWLEGLMKATRNKIAYVLADIRTEHPPDTNLDRPG
jgi:hypothetical protein